MDELGVIVFDGDAELYTTAGNFAIMLCKHNSMVCISVRSGDIYSLLFADRASALHSKRFYRQFRGHRAAWRLHSADASNHWSCCRSCRAHVSHAISARRLRGTFVERPKTKFPIESYKMHFSRIERLR